MDKKSQRLRDLMRNNYPPLRSDAANSFFDLNSGGDNVDFVGIRVSEKTGIAGRLSGGYVGVIGISTTEEIGVWGWTTGSGLLEQKPDTSGDVDIATDAALTSNPGVSIYGLTDGGTAGRFIATGGGRGIVGSTDDATLAGVVARNTASPTPGPALVCENSYAYFEAGLVVNGAGGSATTSDTRIAGDTDTHLIFVDASADKVGISEPAPNATLDVNGTTRLGDSDTNYAAFAADGSQTMHGTATLTSANGIISPVWKPASDSTTAMQMQTAAGAAVVTVDTTNERVGIGTTTPWAPLDVVGQGSFRASDLRPTNVLATNAIDTDYSVLTYWNNGASGGIGTDGQGTSYLANTNFGVALRTGSGYLYLNQAGNVGIGTIAPATRLDIDAGAMTMAEMTAPTGAANKAMLYTKDNGSGKTQLCCKLGDDVEIVIATQA